jgi:hypothetical protein
MKHRAPAQAPTLAQTPRTTITLRLLFLLVVMFGAGLAIALVTT